MHAVIGAIVGGARGCDKMSERRSSPVVIT